MGLQCSVVNTPIRLICSPQSVRCGSYENSHLKIAPSTDVKFENMITQNSISSNKQAKRVLFSCEEDYDVDKLESNRDACDNIPDVSQACTEDSNVSNFVLSQKVCLLTLLLILNSSRHGVLLEIIHYLMQTIAFLHAT